MLPPRDLSRAPLGSPSGALARWADRGAVVVASLAAVALALTVLVARADLRGASEATVRGEGEVLVTLLHQGTDPRNGPPTSEVLAGQLARLRGSGLRFVKVELNGDVARAGVQTIPEAGLQPGAMRIQKDRALLVTPLPGAPPPPGFGLPPPGFGPDPLGLGPPFPPGAAAGDARMIIEFAPAMLPLVEATMTRTAIVAGTAVVVLLAFAVALTLRAVRRARDARKAEQERRLVALGQMSSVMAHELRNPLTSLKGNAQLLAEMLPSGTREQRKAELVVAEAERLEKLTQDLLAFVRDAAPSRAEVAPGALLEQALRGLPRERVQLDLAAAPAVLVVDPSLLAVALGNLVRNALQSDGDDAKVEVRVHELGAAAVIDVRDHGPGIPRGDEERIFEPFFTTRIHGTGLGLAVARLAVEQHGGTLRAESPEGGGALFRVTLPSVEPPR